MAWRTAWSVAAAAWWVATAVLAAPRNSDGFYNDPNNTAPCGVSGAPPCYFRSRVRGALAEALEGLSRRAPEADVLVPILESALDEEPLPVIQPSKLLAPPRPLLWLVESDALPSQATETRRAIRSRRKKSKKKSTATAKSKSNTKSKPPSKSNAKSKPPSKSESRHKSHHHHHNAHRQN